MATPFGRYRYERMPMNIVCAPEIYQRAMEDLFGDLPTLEIIVDEILVHAENWKGNLKHVGDVLMRARDRNVKFSKDKLKLMLPEVDYIGHTISG